MSATPRLACCESLKRMRVGSLCMLKWSATSGLFSVSTCAARKHRGAAVSANLAAGLTARFADARCIQHRLVGLQAPRVRGREAPSVPWARAGVQSFYFPASSLPLQTPLCRGARARWPLCFCPALHRGRTCAGRKRACPRVAISGPAAKLAVLQVVLARISRCSQASRQKRRCAQKDYVSVHCTHQAVQKSTSTAGASLRDIISSKPATVMPAGTVVSARAAVRPRLRVGRRALPGRRASISCLNTVANRQ